MGNIRRLDDFFNKPEAFLVFIRYVQNKEGSYSHNQLTVQGRAQLRAILNFYANVGDIEVEGRDVGLLQTKRYPIHAQITELLISFFYERGDDRIGPLRGVNPICDAAYDAIGGIHQSDYSDRARDPETFSTLGSLLPERSEFSIKVIFEQMSDIKENLVKPILSQLFTDWLSPAANKKREFVDEHLEQKKKLKGTLRNVRFVYYEEVFMPYLEIIDKDIIIIGDGFPREKYKDFSTSYAKCTIVKKGTKTFSRQRYFRFRRDGAFPSKEQMFAALKKTGWNMANLKSPQDLIIA